MGNIIENIIKDTNANDLLETAQEKLEDGTLDPVLEKVGIDREKVSRFTTTIRGIIDFIKSLIGQRSNTNGVEDETDKEEEEADEEDIEE